MTNNNYVDARTPEEIANAPKGVITYASSMNNNTLKERKNWEDDFDNLKIKYQTSKGIVLDDITLLDDETTDTIKAFISSKIQQAKEERDTEWKKAINSSALYHLEYDKASAFASDVLLILNTK